MSDATLTARLLRQRRALAALLVLLHLLLAGAYSVWNPLGEAPDEADHWAYIVYLARERRLPEGPTITQSKHPPFYHATAAAVASLGEPDFGFLRANPDIAIVSGPTQSPNFFVHTTLEAWPWHGGAAAFHLARLWSVLLSAATVAAVYGLARCALPERPGVALLATGLAATIPEKAFIGGALNNDNAAALFGVLALWGGFALYHNGGAWRAGWWTPLALGLGLISKASSGALWPVVGAMIVLGAAQHAATDRHPQHSEGSPPTPVRFTALRVAQSVWAARRRWLTNGLIVFVPALLLAAPWFVRNWRLYGDPAGMSLARQTIDLRTTGWGWAESWWLVHGWFVSSWGKFGGAGHLPFADPVYWAALALTLGALAGLAWGLVRRPQERVSVALLALAGAAVAIGIWRYSLVALGTDQGRLLYPAFGAGVLLFALGLGNLVRGRAAAWLGSGLVMAMAGLAIYGLVGVIGAAFARPTLPDAGTVAAAALPAPVAFGELTLVAATMTDEVTLFWHAETRPRADWRTELRVSAQDGTVVWSWRRSPGYGRWPTDHWPAGTTVADTYRIGWPEWAGPGVYRVAVALQPFGEPWALPPGTTADAPWVTVGEIVR